MINALNAFEISILRSLYALVGCPVLDVVLKYLTYLGEGGAVWIAITLVLLFIPKTRRAGLCSALAMIMCLVVGNLMLKPFFARPRPFQFDNTITLLIAEPTEFSFPSGHSMNGFAAAVSMRLYHRRGGNAAVVLAAVIAFSRLYFMVHYPTDVLVGIAIGCIAAVLSRRIIEYAGEKRRAQ